MGGSARSSCQELASRGATASTEKRPQRLMMPHIQSAGLDPDSLQSIHCRRELVTTTEKNTDKIQRKWLKGWKSGAVQEGNENWDHLPST